MKVLICLSLFFGVAFCEQELGAYKYQYNTGQISKNEMRFPNGTVSGRYNFLDVHNLNHEVVYTVDSDQEFKVLSHTVTDNGETYHINVDQTPEVQNSGDSHTAFQNYLHTVLPQASAEGLPTVYIRHVPSPVKEEPVVPIINVNPPTRVLQQQIQEATQVVTDSPRKVLVVNNIPPHAQLGSARSLFVQDVQPHVSIKVEEIPADFIQAADRLHPISVPVQAHPQQHQYSQHQEQHIPEIVHNQIHQIQEPVQPHIHHIHQVYPQPLVEGDHQTVVVVPPQTVPQYIQYQPNQGLTAQDVQLVNGFTVEVAKATQEHLSHVAAARASLQAAKYAEE